MLTPPVAKIGANSGQQVKIKIMPNKLPSNKESIFYLNVMDIPPNSPEQEGKNVLKFAMQNRIKLFYRPAGIAPVNKATFNWVTISDVKANNVKVNYETIMIAPLESQSVNVKTNNANSWYLTIIDDDGNYISDKI